MFSYQMKANQGKRNFVVLLSIVSAFSFYNCNQLQEPPYTRQDNVKEILHGVEIVDPYRWLEDQNSAETREWIRLQNKYTNDLLSNHPSRAAIKSRLRQLMNVDQTGSVMIRGNRYFIWKKGADKELWSLYYRKGIEGTDIRLLDPHMLSEDNSLSYSIQDISTDGKLLIYGIRKGGEDEIEVRIMDVDSKNDLPDRLPRALYSAFSFKNDKSGFFYGTQNRDRGPRTYFHKLGTDYASDQYLFGKGILSDKWVSAFVSDDDKYLIIVIYHGWARSDIYIKNINKDSPFIPVVKDKEATFFPSYAGNRLFLHTNWKAPNGRIVSIDPENTSIEHWQEIIPEKEDAIQNVSFVGGHLYVHYLHNVSSRVLIYTTEGAQIGELPLPGPGSIRGPWGNWDRKDVIFEFKSYIQPGILFQYNPMTNESIEWVKSDVDFNQDLFQVSQIWYTSKDGTEVPMFLVRQKDLKLNGDNPTLLYGYGGFNVSLTPHFSSMAALWIEQGGIYAVANIRGGGEFGEEWHRAGMLENKQNVFDDFISAGEWLIDNNYTSSSKLAIIGYSNGGLLVGSCLTQRPDLYQAVLCLFPDLDMLGYYRFENNNPPALGEYGNASNPEHFNFLVKYSPYQNVKAGTNYPAVLLATGDADTRVPPLQARKMTARLQSTTISDRPVLLMYDTKAGHSGGKPQSKQIEDLSMELAFLFWQLGMEYN